MCECVCVCLCVVCLYVSMLPSACLRVCFHGCSAGGFGWHYMCVLAYVCVCVNETDMERESRGAGQRAAPLRGRVLFSRRLHLSSRCHTSCWCTHCQSHRARVAQRGAEGHRESVCVSLCEVMLEREVAGCRTKQLSGNGNSKGHCCLSILCITPNHIDKN